MIQLPTNIDKLRAAWRVVNNIEPQPPGGCYSIKNSEIKNSNGTTKFYVFDVIGGSDDDAASFVKAVHEVTTKSIELYINSPGGFVFDVIAMYDALINSISKVNVKITGLAASAASFLAMSGDDIEIAEPGRMMIHDAQGIGIGSPAELREYADLLDNFSDDIAGIYAKRAGGKSSEWRSAMTATTWYSSAQAVEAKLVDRVSKGKTGPDNRTRLIQTRNNVLIRRG